MSRTLLRSLLELRAPLPRVTTSPLALVVRSISTTTPTPSAPSASSSSAPVSKTALYPPEQPVHKPLSDSVRSLLPVLAAQPAHYITIHVHGVPYLVTRGDHVRLPFRMPGVGHPFVDERLFECKATVLGVEAEPMREKTKTKRRNRKVKTVKSKHKYTILSISHLKVNTPEEVGA
ncbi:unnamed protein product [Parascedosporium putredinis]|uniref:Uncharacterized protein n=1 Tax=Parascedosporium putredinis TaxID=1442378 RepID=A0A9P1MBS1_9PEZI|nr:unnamed protein product [Parascedosporium putredinis]CAI7999302.1 unnamed protein product [Parascedosporium putredinis]